MLLAAVEAAQWGLPARAFNQVSVATSMQAGSRSMEIQTANSQATLNRSMGPCFSFGNVSLVTFSGPLIFFLFDDQPPSGYDLCNR
jgi:hypothetical protein